MPKRHSFKHMQRQKRVPALQLETRDQGGLDDFETRMISRLLSRAHKTDNRH